MMWFFAVLIVLALGAVAMVAAGWGTPMTEEYDDRPDAVVPADRTLVADDLRRVRFSLAFRGYRASEVDTLLDRLASEMSHAAETTEPAEGTHPAERTQPAERTEPAALDHTAERGDTAERAPADIGAPEPGHAASADDGTGRPD